mgnify:CR=1 FL=1
MGAGKEIMAEMVNQINSREDVQKLLKNWKSFSNGKDRCHILTND